MGVHMEEIVMVVQREMIKLQMYEHEWVELQDRLCATQECDLPYGQ